MTENSKLLFEINIGAKSPSTVPYAMGSAEIRGFVYENDNFETVLDDLKEKLSEALAASLLVAEGKN